MNSNDLLFYIFALRQQMYSNTVDSSAVHLKLRKLIAIWLLIKKNKRNQRPAVRKFWVHPIFSYENRLLQGASENLIKELQFHNDNQFFNYFRMNVEMYQELLNLVEPLIAKQECIRMPIPANTRLEICLRYLASGDSMKSLSYAYRVGHNTCSKIVSETCEAIWTVLKDKVFPSYSEDTWKKIANKFENRWNFPNYIGAVDGKHVMIQAPPHSGSTYYNYKSYHSLNLLAVCDAEYCFTFLDIGAEGRQSDGGVFRNSSLYKALEENLIRIPPPDIIGNNGPDLPYVIVADEAFPLKTYMMRPFPRSQQLNKTRKIFNYRLSRARRVIENAFGILAARWRIFRKPIIASISTCKKIIQATCCLHNFIMKRELQKLVAERVYSTMHSHDYNVSTGLIDSGNIGTNFHSQSASVIRDTFAVYFEGHGSVAWQWEKVLQNDF